MATSRPVRPWDDDVERELLDDVAELPRQRLRDAAPPSVPGVYLQFFALDPHSEAGATIAGALGADVACGRWPAYIGSASASLGSRVGRYRQSFAGITLFDEDDVGISWMPCRSRAGALFAEAVLLERLPTPLNGTGFGSRVPGRHRSTQKPSPVDSIIPGRRWAPPTTRRDEALARLLILANLSRRDPTCRPWPALS